MLLTPKIPSRPKAFTLTEIIITIIIMAIIMTLASIKYTRTMAQSYEQDLLLQMRVINNMLEVERRMQGDFPTANMSTLNEINTTLQLQIPASNYYTSYAYVYTPPTGTPPGTYALTVGTKESWAITYSSTTGKYACSAGTCPSCTATSCD